MLVFIVGFILGFIFGCVIVLPDAFRKFKNGRKLSEIGQGRKFETQLVMQEEKIAQRVEENLENENVV